MDAHGYLFKGYASKAAPDFTPSLIGQEPGASKGTGQDAYFERVEIDDRHIDTIKRSRWAVFDNSDADAAAINPTESAGNDPILAVKGRAGSYYIPLSELYEIAASNHDDDTIALIEKLFPNAG
ncbi:hypothetical protein LAV_00192 [Sphingobium phage Lacusarx]|uniref:Uncharacterized protein n=1 Tax=Sphingobium phage Lacusarx TaxID=1980139 RepID=A0A1W6DX26_9CAUD|nr:hypothetical protein FDH44_gp111 [Sphingobium phage Lacusarx]ARK07567.1 hypothetical protein LAV_00192 [Sphingobium phage Lacusarx]